MERSFIVSKDSEYYKDTQEHYKRSEKQRIFVNNFFKEKGIEANEYLVGGNGFVNRPFKECWKKDIILNFKPTENDLIKFGKILTIPNENNLRSVKRNSSLGKEFSQRCIDEEIVINLHSPKPRDYFRKLGWAGYNYSQFMHNEVMYLKIESKYLQEDDMPDGFTEIRLSEFYKALEEFESKENK